MVVVPCVLLGLLAWIYADLPGDIFNRIGPALLGVFPFVVMFIVTSISTLRERTNGTLERLLTTPLGKGDLMLGYALAFGAMAVLQAPVATGFAVWVCGLDIAGPLWLLVVVAVFDAVLGTALGLLASGFARTEFQAVQFMPAFVLPQFLLCGLLVPRELLPPALEAISNVLPLSYAVDAMKDVTVMADPLADVLPSLGVIALWIAGRWPWAASPCAAAPPEARLRPAGAATGTRRATRHPVIGPTPVGQLRGVVGRRPGTSRGAAAPVQESSLPWGAHAAAHHRSSDLRPEHGSATGARICHGTSDLPQPGGAKS